MANLAIVNKNIFAKIVVVILLETITIPIRVVIPKLMNRFGEWPLEVALFAILQQLRVKAKTKFRLL